MQLDSAIFYTKDLNKTVEFYRDTLGFEVDYVQENRFASFNLGGAKLGIKQAKEEREVPGHQTIFVSIPDIEKFYQEIQQKQLNILKSLTHDDWATNFSILDPDGNKIQFIQEK